jgi:nicotinamidase-related amidase
MGICVLFTANDAHMRGYHVVVPRDCTASNTPALTRSALRHVAIALAGDVGKATSVDFAALSRHPRKPRGQTF